MFLSIALLSGLLALSNFASGASIERIESGDSHRRSATFYLPSPQEASGPTSNRANTQFVYQEAKISQRSRESHRPLVILLHAYPSTGKLENWYVGLSHWVDSKNFFLLLPEGTENKWGAQFWNATDSCCDSYQSHVDDVGYLKNLIESVANHYAVDRERIYLIGHSAGGYMVNRMACESGELFAGLVSFAGGGYLNELDCAHPIANTYLQIHASNDSQVAIDSDLIRADYAGRKQMVANWQGRNHCNPTLRATRRLDLIQAIQGDDTQEWQATGCEDSRDVYFWQIDSHSEPFYIPHVPALNPSTSEMILDFLFQYKNNRATQR